MAANEFTVIDIAEVPARSYMKRQPKGYYKELSEMLRALPPGKAIKIELSAGSERSALTGIMATYFGPGVFQTRLFGDFVYIWRVSDGVR